MITVILTWGSCLTLLIYLTALNTIEEAKAVDFWLQYNNFQYLNEKGL